MQQLATARAKALHEAAAIFDTKHDQIKHVHNYHACTARDLRAMANEAGPAIENPVEPNCSNCANKGKVYGLSQEMCCDHCVWQGREWRQDLFLATKGCEA